MTTLFDLLNTLNNNNSNSSNNGLHEAFGCRRPCQMKPTTTSNNSNKKTINIIPEMDVTMYDDRLVIDVELVGVTKDNIEIDIKDSILTIQGEKKKNSPTTTTNTNTTTSTINNAPNYDKDEPSIEEFEDGYDEKLKINKTTASSESSSSYSLPSTTSKDKESPNGTNNSTDKKYISERSFGYFKRYLDLTKVLYQLDLNSISTKFENGVLSIEIKKKSNYSNTFKISIN